MTTHNNNHAHPSPTLREAVRKRIIILDGAMGTMIQDYGLKESDFWNETLRKSLNGDKTAADVQMKGNNDVLNLTRPDIIADIHQRYLDAGADLIETNTFSSQRISQSDYHLENFCYDMALAGARIARSMADEFATPQRPRYVAGSIGPNKPHLLDVARREICNPQSHHRPNSTGLCRTNKGHCSTAVWTHCSSKPSSTRSMPKWPWTLPTD